MFHKSTIIQLQSANWNSYDKLTLGKQIEHKRQEQR